MVRDGLWDVYQNKHMGNCAETCASERNISREEQDTFAIESYTRAASAWDAGKFDNEVVPVEVPQRKGDPIIVNRDEEYTNVKIEKNPFIKTCF